MSPIASEKVKEKISDYGLEFMGADDEVEILQTKYKKMSNL